MGQHQRKPGGQQHGQHDLKKAEAKDMFSHGAEFGQVELEANHKHQENNSEFAQMAHPFRIFRQGQRIGADHHAHG